jgi:outer membrane protein assembly factor BamA
MIDNKVNCKLKNPILILLFCRLFLFMRRYSGYLFIIFLLATFQSCSPYRHLKENQYLVRKVRLHLKTDRTLSEKGALSENIVSLLGQKPNTYLFGFIPYKLWLYELRYKKYQRDSTNFQLTSKVVEQPVILDTALVEISKGKIMDYLHNEGYFYASVEDTIKYIKNKSPWQPFTRKKAFVNYYVRTGLGYLIDSVQYDIQNKELASLTGLLKKETLLKSNKPYSNTLAGVERSRLTNLIRNQGYYKFSADNIAFELDTIEKSYARNMENPFVSAINFVTLQQKGKKPSLDVKIIIHPTNDSLAFQKYTFKNVVVFPDYEDTGDLRDGHLIQKEVNGITFRYHNPYVHPTILDKKIFIRPGDLYSQSAYNQTISQLNDLGIFQYVRLFIFADRRDSLNHKLNCYILMNPNKKFDFNTNVEASGGDLYVIGTSANVSVTDKNFFKGANQLTTTLSYGIELGQNKNKPVPYFNQFYLFSQNLGVNFRLNFPKFLLPINQSKFSQNALPHSLLEAGVNSLRRTDYFSLRSINASFGYVWNETDIKSWIVKPVFMNVLHLSNVNPDFQERMDSVPAIGNSYQETFIEGESLSYLINTEGRKKWQHAYLKLGFEEAGALMSGINGLSRNVAQRQELPYAQYIRFDFDGRQYFVQRNSALIFRLSGGIGIPYGKSSVLPYLKQYFVGGAYSIRGWRPRVLGPGSYYDSAKQNSSDNLFIDQSGDIKLEANAEYRFNMIKLFSDAVNINGAVFADGGNIWLAREDPSLPGAEFRFNTLYQDIALSTGAGLRADFGGFLVIRLDWAFPIKKPYVLKNNGWVIDQISFGDKTWRRQNINFNIAIGYPF